MPIETERLILRPWALEDAVHYEEMAQDIGYNCFAPPGVYLVRDRAEALAKIQQRIELFQQHRVGKWPIFRKSDGAFVGTCGADFFSLQGQRELEIGYRMLLSHWGQGYATEAALGTLAYLFQELGARSVFAFAVKQNAASIKVLEKLGFRHRQPIDHAGFEHQLFEVSILTAL